MKVSANEMKEILRKMASEEELIKSWKKQGAVEEIKRIINDLESIDYSAGVLFYLDKRLKELEEAKPQPTP